MSSKRIQLSDGSGNNCYPIADGYFPGETYNGHYIEICAGYWFTSKVLRFYIPLGKPIYATSCTLTGLYRVVSNGKSFDEEISSGTIVVNLRPTGLAVQVTYTSDKATANHPAAVALHSVKMVFA